MLLTHLRDYSDLLSQKVALSSMYVNTPIRWIIDIDARGRCIGFTARASARGARGRPLPYPAPHLGRTVAVSAKLLADNAEYVLGLGRTGSDPQRVALCHAAFVRLVRDCAERTGEREVVAVSQFLQSLDRRRLALPSALDATDVVTFRVDNILPIDLPAVRAYWALKARESTGSGIDVPVGGAPDNVMTCVVCGESRPPVGTIPIKIKRIPRGQKAGMALVSANSAAFESYGLDAISGAPICLKCGEGFSKAANALIEADDTHLTIGPTVYIFWTTQRSKAQRGAVEFQPARLLGRPTPEQFAALAALDVSDATLHAAAFSASGARVVVRDYLMTGVGQARQNLACYFTIQQLVGPDGSDSKPISLFALAASVVRDANRDLPAEVTKILVHTALEGGPLPTWLLYQAVKRNRVEQRVTRPRAALVKMVLLSQHDWTVGRAPDGRMSHLTSKDPILEQPRKRQAYHCGRLLAMIERTQRAALGFPKATIAGRFFATASTAPAAVFGRLMRLNGSHLEKLRKEWPNAYAALHARIEEITHPHLPGFPQTLNLDEQGLFSLGYYHQHAHDRGEASARRRAREAGKKSA